MGSYLTEHCHRSSGTLKIIAPIEDPSVIAKILAYLGLPTRAPHRSFNLFAMAWFHNDTAMSSGSAHEPIIS
jgi:hypothetical protein